MFSFFDGRGQGGAILTFRPSCVGPTEVRSARCLGQRTFCRITITMSIKGLECQYEVNSHESESSRPPCLVVLHNHTVDDFTVAAEVSLQAVLGRLPAEASDEEFAG